MAEKVIIEYGADCGLAIYSDRTLSVTAVIFKIPYEGVDWEFGFYGSEPSPNFRGDS